jgi:hypothetical protein
MRQKNGIEGLDSATPGELFEGRIEHATHMGETVDDYPARTLSSNVARSNGEPSSIRCERIE